MSEPDKRWFRPKTFGYGATPNSWQGWLMTFGFIVAVLAEAFYLPSWIGQGPAGAAVMASVAAFVLTVYKLSGQRWTWRSGRRE